jgi:hypothetical protein
MAPDYGSLPHQPTTLFNEGHITESEVRRFNCLAGGREAREKGTTCQRLLLPSLLCQC